jgi:hypothetical protein
VRQSGAAGSAGTTGNTSLTCEVIGLAWGSSSTGGTDSAETRGMMSPTEPETWLLDVDGADWGVTPGISASVLDELRDSSVGTTKALRHRELRQRMALPRKLGSTW